MKKPVVLLSFAANDLEAVKTEAANAYASVKTNEAVQPVLLEDADIDSLAEAAIDHGDDIFMFHYGGHANQNKVVLHGLRDLDKIRLTRLLGLREGHRMSLASFNGCLTYGHVGLLTAKGVKAVIATNVRVGDNVALRLSKFFYKCFFEKGYTLKESFERAEATVTGSNAYPVIVNPGEIDEKQAMPSSWTLYIHSAYKEVIDWTLADFIKDEKSNPEHAAPQGGNIANIQGDGNQVIQGVKDSTININADNEKRSSITAKNYVKEIDNKGGTINFN